MRSGIVLSHANEVIEAQVGYICDNPPVLEESCPNFHTLVLAHKNMSEAEGADLFTTTPLPYLTLLREAFKGLRGGLREPIRSELLGYIAGTLLPGVEGLTNSGYSPISAELSKGSTGNCADAERYFVRTLKQIAKPHGFTRASVLQRQVSVYHDKDSVPIALRKRTISSSALLLRPVNVGEAVIPPGTLVSIDSEMGCNQTGRYKTANGAVWNAFEVEDDAFSMSPLRLSPWAFSEPIDRALFGIDAMWRKSGFESLDYSRRRANLVSRYGIENFCLAAEKLLQLAQTDYMPNVDSDPAQVV